MIVLPALEAINKRRAEQEARKLGPGYYIFKAFGWRRISADRWHAIKARAEKYCNSARLLTIGQR